MINGQKYFGQPIENDLRTKDNIRKIATGQGDYYLTGCVCWIIPISKDTIS